MAGFIPLFPLVFASSAFVPVANMPGWLQAFANNQPVSLTVTASRALLTGTPTSHFFWPAVLLSLAIFSIFVLIAVRRYAKVTS